MLADLAFDMGFLSVPRENLDESIPMEPKMIPLITKL